MTKKLLILGGGFGLYGYMPAAISRGWEVTTLDKYSELISTRPELRNYSSNLKLVNEESLEFNLYQGVVIARTPLLQIEILKNHISYAGHFFLEKPLGIDVATHLDILTFLQESQCNFTVAYLFRYQEWYREVMKAKTKNAPIDLHWKIPRNSEFSWKSHAAFGGGLFSYYGVHLFSLLVDLGYAADSLRVTGDESSLHLEAIDSLKPHRFFLEFSETPGFRVTLENQTWRLTSPFGAIPLSGEIDPRISSLKTYLGDGIEKNSSCDQIEHEFKIIKLSQAVEQIL